MTDPRSEEVMTDQSTNEIELDPRPRVMRLNNRALFLGPALLSVLVVAASLTLSEVNTRMEEQAEEASVGASAPDPFWTDEPDALVKQNQQEEKRAFLEKAALGREDATNPNPVRAPASPYAVMAGSLVPAVLVTGANSDLPRALTARVRENVYDTATGGQLLIPQCTLLVGQYDSTVTYGQERLLAAWQRMIFPDGSSLNLGSMPGVDHAGASGFKDRVNNHYVRIFGSAFLLSAISAGLQISQGDSGSSSGDDGQNIRQTLAAALGQNLGEVSTEMVRRNMQIQPRIEIRAGCWFNVFVNRDLLMPGPYASS